MSELITCEVDGCGKQMSPYSPTCPSCGHPRAAIANNKRHQNANRIINKVAFGFIVLFLLLTTGCFGLFDW